MAKPQTDEATRRQVVDYYDGSWFDYRVVWLNKGTLAKHFGYWEPHIKNHGDSLLNMNKQVASRVNPKPGERVLDAGCGVGGSSIWLARTFGLNTVGISLSEKELERARRYAAERGVSAQCSFEVQDFINTTFPDASFDIVWAQESFCHAMDKGAWMKEMFRLLKPGGRLVIEDWFRPTRPYHPADEAMYREWLRGWAIDDLATKDEIVQDAEAAGFANARLDDITPYIVRSVRRLYAMTVVLFPGAYMGKLLKLRSDVLHRNIVSARLQWRARNRNLWISGIFSAQKPALSEAPAGEPAESTDEPLTTAGAAVEAAEAAADRAAAETGAKTAAADAGAGTDAGEADAGAAETAAADAGAAETAAAESGAGTETGAAETVEAPAEDAEATEAEAAVPAKPKRASGRAKKSAEPVPEAVAPGDDPENSEAREQ